MSPHAPETRIGELLQHFKLTTAAEEMVPRLLQEHQSDALPIVLEVLELEEEARRNRRIQRLRSSARIPAGKTFETLEIERLPPALARQLRELATGRFLDQAINVLAFGLPDLPTYCTTSLSV